MNGLLAFARGIDWISDRFGAVAKWAVIASCFISATNAIVRYSLDYSSNSVLEIRTPSNGAAAVRIAVDMET